MCVFTVACTYRNLNNIGLAANLDWHAHAIHRDNLACISLGRGGHLVGLYNKPRITTLCPSTLTKRKRTTSIAASARRYPADPAADGLSVSRPLAR